MNGRPKKPRIQDRSVQAELWRRGVIGAWKYDSTEIDMNRELDEKLSLHQRVVLLAGRRTGKSFILIVRAIEYALKNPGTLVKYISSTKKSIVDYFLPIYNALIEDCPADIRPLWVKTDGMVRFTNGSQISVFGTDAKNFTKLRGQAANFTVLDEAGFMTDLEKTVVSVLSPQSLRTDGWMIMSSTAPDLPGHEFVKFILAAREEGSCIERTIYQRLALGSTWQTPEEEAADNAKWLAKAIKDCFGESTAAFRREYLNDLGATESTRAAVPVFTDALCKGHATKPGVIREVKRPIHCHKYSSTDAGFIDLSASVFGYLVPGNPRAEEPDHFLWSEAPAGALVIEDELVATKVTSDKLAPLILSVEQRLWGAERPLVRCVDGNPEQLEQLRRVGLEVVRSANNKPDAAIDEVQKLLVRGLLIIHPRCVRTRACMQAAVWKKDGSKLDRHPEHGHFDLLMALAYLARNLRRYESPFPAGHGAGPRGPGVDGGVSQTVKTLRAGFKTRLPFGS